MSYRVEAVLSAVDSGFTSRFNRATKSVQRLQNQANRVSGVVDNVGKRMTKAGAAMTLGFTYPIVKGVKAAGKSFMEFEDGLIGIGKTTDMSGKQLESYGDDIARLATQIPIPTKELLNLSETAGQLGIHGSSSLLEFTRVMAEMGTATNLAGVEGAKTMAQFANVMGLDVEKSIRQVGNSVVRLGNNFSTSEKDIMDMSSRLAASARLVGLTTPEVLGLSTAMSALKIRAEAGGSAMSQVMTKIDKAVAGGGRKLQNFASVAGMTADQFASTWQSSPMDAIQALMKGLNDVEKSGGNMNQVLEMLGITGIRESNTVKALAQNHELLSQAISDSTDAYQHGNDLQEEFAKACESLSSKLALLANIVGIVAKDLFATFEPAISAAVDALNTFLVGWLNLDKGTKQAIGSMVGKIAAFLAAMGPVMLIGGRLVSAFSPIIGVLSTVGSSFKLFTMGLSSTNSAFSAVSKGMKSAAGSLGDKFLEVGTTFPKFGNKALEMYDKMAPVPGKIKSGFTNKIGESVSALDNKFGTHFQSMGSKVGSFGGRLGKGLGKAGSLLNTFGINTGNAVKLANAAMSSLFPAAVIGAALVGLGVLYSKFGEQIDKLLQVAKTKGPEIIQRLGDGITSRIPELVSKGTQLVVNFADALQANIPMIMQQGVAIIEALVSSVGANAGNLIAAAIPVIGNFISGLVQAIPRLLAVGMQFLVNLAQGIIQNIPLILQTAVQIAQNFANSIAENGPQIMQSGIQLIVMLVKGIVTNIPAIISAAWEIIKALASGILQALSGVLGTVVEGVTSFFKNIFKPGKDEAENSKEQITSTLQSSSQEIDAVTGAAAQTATQNAAMGRQSYVSQYEGMNTDVSAKLSQLQANTGLSMSQIQQEIMTKGEIARDGITITAGEMNTLVSGEVSSMADNVTSEAQRGAEGANTSFDNINSKIPADAMATNEQTSGQYEDLANRISTSTDQANTAVTSGMETINSNFKMRLGTLPAETDTILMNVSNSFTNAFNALGKGVSSKVDNIVSNYTKGLNKLNSSTTSGLNKLSSGFSNSFNKITNTVNQGTNKVVSSITNMNNRVNSSFTSFSNRFTSTNRNMWNKFVSTGKSKMNQHYSSFNSHTNKMQSRFRSFTSQFKSLNNSTWSQVVSRTRSAGNQMSSAFSNACNRTRSLASNLRNSLISIMNSSVGGMRSAGYNAGMGFYSGLASTRGAIMGLASSIASSVSARIRSALRIHSPSRVLMKLGNYTGQGLAVGIDKSRKFVNKAVDGLSNLVQGVDTSLDSSYQSPSLGSDTKPAVFVLKLGGSEYRAFSRDISKQQEQDLRLEANFGL